MPVPKFWAEKLEAKYKEPAFTLIPRLLNYYGEIAPLAEEAGVSNATISRWCDANGIERRWFPPLVEKASAAK